VCDEKLHLLTAYDRSANQFSAQVNRLTRDVGKLSKSEYDAMLLAVERARLNAESARLALDQHAMTHRC
jgi:hypothetical protein